MLYSAFPHKRNIQEHNRCQISGSTYVRLGIFYVQVTSMKLCCQNKYQRLRKARQDVCTTASSIIRYLSDNTPPGPVIFYKYLTFLPSLPYLPFTH